MQTIEGTIQQKEAEVARLLGEIETLRKAQELLGTPEPAPVKRMGRPKGSKNKSTGKKRRARKASKKAAVEKAVAAPTPAPSKKTRKSRKSASKRSKKNQIEAPAEG